MHAEVEVAKPPYSIFILVNFENESDLKRWDDRYIFSLGQQSAIPLHFFAVYICNITYLLSGLREEV